MHDDAAKPNGRIAAPVNTAMSGGGFDDPGLAVWMEGTPMSGSPAPIAALILFLTAVTSSATTGAVLLVDCGCTIW